MKRKTFPVSIAVKRDHSRLKSVLPEDMLYRMDFWGGSGISEIPESISELINAVDSSKYLITYIGEFIQSKVCSNKPYIIPFIIVQTEEQMQLEGLEGKMLDAYGLADIKGTITPQTIEFIKKYEETNENSNEIKYTGTIEENIYKGEWSFNSQNQLVKGTFEIAKIR